MGEPDEMANNRRSAREGAGFKGRRLSAFSERANEPGEPGATKRGTIQARLCTMSTVRPECAATAPATLPKKMPGNPLLPWEPRTIRLAS